jgi:peptidoglycan/LPS O-acetylase OafA/YrhL
MLHVPVGLTLLNAWQNQFGPQQSGMMGFTALLLAFIILFTAANLVHNYFEKPLRQWMTHAKTPNKKSEVSKHGFKKSA